MKVEGGRTGLPVPNKPHGFRGRKTTWEKENNKKQDTDRELSLGQKFVVDALESPTAFVMIQTYSLPVHP